MFETGIIQLIETNMFLLAWFRFIDNILQAFLTENKVLPWWIRVLSFHKRIVNNNGHYSANNLLKG